MSKKNWLTLALAIIGTEFVGFLSSLFAGDIRAMYDSLEKIPLSPPGGLFGIVWPILYLLLGISLYLIITSDANSRQKQMAYLIYAVQLFLNFLWSIVFFGGDKMGLAIIIILLLDAAVVYQIFYYRKISMLSAYLLVPYLLWLLFATYLNIGFALVN